MSHKVIKLVLISFVYSIFLSCKGQATSEAKTFEIGKIVSEIDNRICVIFQDSKGKCWFGSNGKGIYYFAEDQLKQITTENGLVDNTIRGIQEDKKGNVFIETPEGISKYDGLSFKTLKPIISPNNVWKLEPDDLWFGYDANDVYRYDGDSLFQLKLPRQDLKNAFGIDTLTSPFDSNNPYSIYGINKDKEGNIWFGTFVAGAFRYDGTSFLWIDEKELSILPGNIAPGVRSILQDKDGYFWLSNFKSKYKIDPDSLEYKKLKGVEKDKSNYFNAGLSDTKGNLWMTTYGGGVWKYDGKTLSNFEIKNGNEDVLLYTIYQDNKGGMWLGTENNGVYKFNGETFEKFEITN